ncbi:hypothetical protein [Flavihumibacter sp. UBA7668]|uniref:hypothetical protein n=1 Tax=Flavihumibacter sp. UBA7668 TaxID=1946542 RepID=UPI0025BFE59A|nr:hypothetical protein [Flavihumibacter sp. UBA7668]
MEKIKIELKWAIYFSLMVLAWMSLEKMVGLHDKHIDYHLYLTNLFAIPAIAALVMGILTTAIAMIFLRSKTNKG